MDVKKLITSFLIVAAAAGSSALLLSTIGGSSPATPQSANTAQLADADNNAPAVGQNAFLPQYDTTSVTTTDATTTPDDPNNLTDNVADAFVNEFASANNADASNLQLDENGNANFASPDPQAIANDLAATPALQNIQMPNWDKDVAAQSVSITSDSSPTEIAAYVSSLSDIYNQYFVQSGAQNAIDANSDTDSDPSVITNVSPSISAALTDVSGIKTPAPLASFQKSLVKVLVYEKNAVALLQEASTDPAKASLVYQSEDGPYNAAAQDLQGELTKLTSSNVLSFKSALPGTDQAKENAVFALINTLVGIKTANAQFIVQDPALILVTQTNQTINFSHQLWKELQNVLLQILKNTLITFIQKRALQWVTGGSTPRFIQQLGVQLINSGIAAANRAINAQMQCIYPAFQKPVVTTLQLYYKTSAGGVASCPILPIQTALGGNTLTQFNNNFSNGGWNALGASILPSGNYYGNTFFGAQVADAAAHTAQQSTQSKNVAGQGFTGDQKCSDGSDPVNGTHLVCYDPDSGTEYDAYPSTTCDPSDTPMQAPNAGFCANGDEPNVTTPAQVTNQAFSGSITSNIHQVVSANNLVGILVAMVNSLFNSLMQVAISSATGAINSGLNSAGSNPASGSQSGTLGGAAAGASPPPQAVACSPTQEQLYLTVASSTQTSAFFGATGGTTDANGLAPTYTWTAIGGSANPATQTGASFNPIYTVPPAPGTYNYSVQVTASTGGSATCQVQINAQ
jgi:uncharacterized spore protein YtfJ